MYVPTIGSTIVGEREHASRLSVFRSYQVSSIHASISEIDVNYVTPRGFVQICRTRYSWDRELGAPWTADFAPRKLIGSMPIKLIMVKELVDATGYLVDVIVGQLQGLEGTQTFSKNGTWHT